MKHSFLFSTSPLLWSRYFGLISFPSGIKKPLTSASLRNIRGDFSVHKRLISFPAICFLFTCFHFVLSLRPKGDALLLNTKIPAYSRCGLRQFVVDSRHTVSYQLLELGFDDFLVSLCHFLGQDLVSPLVKWLPCNSSVRALYLPRIGAILMLNKPNTRTQDTKKMCVGRGRHAE